MMLNSKFPQTFSFVVGGQLVGSGASQLFKLAGAYFNGKIISLVRDFEDFLATRND